jgi:guanine deaminase
MVQKELEIGTTTCAYNSSIHAEATNILADMCLKYGQRGIIGKMCILSDLSGDNTESSEKQSLDDTQKMLDHMKRIDPSEALVMPSIQPRGGPWCPPGLMAGLGKKSQNQGGEKIRVQGHMCETLNDMKNTFKVHPGFTNYTEMYQSYGLLHERSIMAHCIHLSDRDIEVLVETKAGVAHNPNSNTCLRAGECKVRQLLNAGVKVGLGTGKDQSTSS